MIFVTIFLIVIPFLAIILEVLLIHLLKSFELLQNHLLYYLKFSEVLLSFHLKVHTFRQRDLSNTQFLNIQPHKKSFLKYTTLTLVRLSF